MKKFALMCLFATMAFGMANAQDEAKKDVPANGAKIRFESLEHNYGDIPKGIPAVCTFTVYNDGNEPLILQNVKPSCGCTTPKYTQKPIMPGQSGTIEASYNANAMGGFNKTITVTSNAVNDPRVVLRIRGTVKENGQAKPEAPQARPMPQPEKAPMRSAAPADRKAVRAADAPVPASR
ncbi:MAG: DUF1573 domain-containing protein [Bacteroidales bacterium]|nr:DUF1573 domain-containing protein [Bacteroidales bacterium]